VPTAHAYVLGAMVTRTDPQPHQRPPPHRMLSNSTKRSYRSHSSSFEADDERSNSTDHENMGPDPALHRRVPSQYAGEDIRLTSKKELWGWYAYGFAAEVYVICGIGMLANCYKLLKRKCMLYRPCYSVCCHQWHWSKLTSSTGSFIPITLEQLSRENGVLLSDHVTPCVKSKEKNSFALLSRLVSPSGANDAGQCVIYFLGMEINTASFALYVFSISVLLQALLVVSISCAADHGNYRKRLLLIFAFVGSAATMAFIFVIPKIYLLGALLAIVSNTCFGASFVLLNSFLPLLVRHHPKTQGLVTESTSNYPSTTTGSDNSQDQIETDENNQFEASTAALLPQENSTILEKATSVELEISTRISSTGIGIGYCAGLFVQCLSIAVLVALGNTNFSLRLVLFIIGSWWLIFTIPAAMWLRPRPGPPMPLDSRTNSKRSWVGYIIHSWTSLYRTLTHAMRLKDITLFLLAWFLLSDAIATVSSTKTSLGMAPPYLALINVIATSAGILGAFTWSFISRHFHMKPIHTILACLMLFELIPLYGLLAYIPAIERLGFLGLQQPWEMYPLGFVYGLVLGGLSSYCRSLFGELIPPGSEAAFYALYAITDKGSSVFGPAIVGMIVDRTGKIRAAFWFLAVLVGLPAPILWFVNVERGKTEAKKLAATIEGFKVSESDDGRLVSGGELSRPLSLYDGEEQDLLAEVGEDHNDDVYHGHVRP